MKRFSKSNVNVVLFIVGTFFLLGTVVPSLGFAQKKVDEAAQRRKLERIEEEYIKNNLKKIRDDIKSVNNHTDKDSRFLVSTDVLHLRDIPEAVKSRIEARKKAIKEVIWVTASDIEKQIETSVILEGTHISARQRKKVEQLNNALQENNVSISSLALAIKGVVRISKALFNKAKTEKNPGRKKDFYIEYTAFVYELCSIVVELLEDFQHEGVAVIDQLYRERKRQVDSIKGRINNQKEKYKIQLERNQITQEEYESKVKLHNNMLDALKVSLTGWDKVFEILNKQKDYAGELKSKEQKFKNLRDDAGLQLSVLAEIDITDRILSSIKDIEKITQISDVPLLKVDAELARTLLGIENRIINKKKKRE